MAQVTTVVIENEDALFDFTVTIADVEVGLGHNYTTEGNALEAAQETIAEWYRQRA